MRGRLHCFSQLAILVPRLAAVVSRSVAEDRKDGQRYLKFLADTSMCACTGDSRPSKHV